MLSLLSCVFYMMSEAVFLVSYVSGTASFSKPLSAKEEAQYIEKYQNGDTDAKNILIERNLRLVAHIAKKYTLKGYDNDDIISIGTIGLIKAIGSFKPEKGVGLSTYAARCIENEILMAIRSGKKLQNEVFLHEPVGRDKEGKEVTIIDKLGTDEEEVFEEVDLKLKIVELYNAMKSALNKREKKIIELRYGLCGCDALTQMEISKMMGISRSYVSRIEKKAIKKLCRKMVAGNE